MYPALFPFISRDSWLGYLSHLGVRSPGDVSHAASLCDRGFIPVLHGTDLGHYLGVSPKLIGHMAKFPQKYYGSFNIPKKSGGVRLIEAPRVFLKSVQRYVLDCIVQQIPLHEAIVGFRPKMNCAVGARRHVGRPFLWNIDLKNFFPTITFDQVNSVFSSIGYRPEVTFVLARLCCLSGRLPQGAPTSPALANVVFSPADESIDGLSKQIGVVYSRYADDLSFSGMTCIPQDFRREIRRIVEALGFHVNDAKTRLMGPRTRREVTGLTVNQAVSIPRKRRRALRALFHQVSINPAAFSGDKIRLLGYAAWVFGYHAEEGRRYLATARLIPDTESTV
jgi:RNA-directed DNA polymerase